MEPEIDIPKETPVMTLNKVVLFPQAMMPLFIFEPRYQQMLQDVLNEHRTFAIAGIDEKSALDDSMFQPPCKTATLGVIRACTVNDDGTAQLLLQGLSRVEIVRIIQEIPYRTIEINLLPSMVHDTPQELESLRKTVLRQLNKRKALGKKKKDDVLTYLERIATPDIFLDITIHAMCESNRVKQSLLETIDTGTRFRRFMRYLENDITQMMLLQQIRGNCEPGDEQSN